MLPALFAKNLNLCKSDTSWVIAILYLFDVDDMKYNVSGLFTKMPRAYMNRTSLNETLKNNPKAFRYSVSYVCFLTNTSYVCSRFEIGNC